jgi:anti-anti-sigma factor
MHAASTPRTSAVRPVVVPLDGPHPVDLILRIARLSEPQGLRIEGELDLIGVPDLTQALASMAKGSIHVDLSGLTFIDVCGLRALVVAAIQMNDDHVLTLHSAPWQLQRLLTLTRWHNAPHLRLEAPAHPLSAA